MNTANASTRTTATANTATMTPPVNGEALSIGNGFSAGSFRAGTVGPAMDPLVMVDHYVMTEPTFGTHPHAGLSAVSLIFENSEGRFHNRDSLGNDFDLLPGDLYWLTAGRGAIHNESPRPGARIHGLQVFVNVPQEFRYEKPSSLLVRRQDMPVLTSDQYSVHVVLGESNGVAGSESPGLPMTILDGQLADAGRFTHELGTGRNAWVHAIEGEIDVFADAPAFANAVRLREGQALAIENTSTGTPLSFCVFAGSGTNAHFAVLDGQAVQQPYVQQGPFVMATAEDIEAIRKDFDAGRFGAID